MKPAPCNLISWTFVMFMFLTVGSTQAFSNEQSIFESWYGEKVIDIILEIDVNAIYENRRTNESFPAQAKIVDQEGNLSKWDIKVKTRGRFRRIKCDFPPLKLNFSKTDLKTSGYNDHDKYKLVTHCLSTSEGDNNILKEYLAYQILHELNPENYRAQLVRITYIDTGSKDRFINYGIIIESTKNLEQRLNAEECEDCYNISSEQFEEDQLQTSALFNYMIGNNDWSIQGLKNTKVLKDLKTGQYKLISYDFDFSGMVSASYASPNVNLGLTNLKERYFLGLPVDSSELSKTIDYFNQKQAEILEIIEKQQLMDNRTKKCITKYINQFYNQLNSNFSPDNIKGLTYIN